MGLNFDQAIPQLDVVTHRLGGSVANHQAQVDDFIYNTYFRKRLH